MELIVRASGPRDEPAVEIVERKGRGHPDTLCDAIAEHVSVRLARAYLERSGAILHHNVDKVLLCAGASRAVLGGGELVEPIEIYLGGRATAEALGARIPVHEIAIDAARERLRVLVPGLDVDRDVRVVSRIRAGSRDLAALFARGRAAPLANDTSCGVGFAPLTALERIVLEVESALTADATMRAHPALGPDVKVMGVRRGERIDLTIGCAMVARHVESLEAYAGAKEVVRAIALETARSLAPRLEADAVVNAGDDLGRGEVYLTVSGSSAEAGDDGQVGRGNRVNGLITPGRPMTLEAAAGKNPVSHVGKLYQLVASRVAQAIAVEHGAGVECTLLSRIGRPVDDPALADIVIHGPPVDRADVERTVRHELASLDALRAELLAERIRIC